MDVWDMETNCRRITAMEERMKIMYNENIRSPSHSVPHYISYLRRYVSQTEDNIASSSGNTDQRLCRQRQAGSVETQPAINVDNQSSDSISPLSYFIRKLKLDLKISLPSFIEEFIQSHNNGLCLLLSLLKIVQAASLNPMGSVNKTAVKGTLKMENYKQNMIDEQDCLLCIKYTLRIRAAVDEIMDHSSGLFILTTSLLSNFSRSRIAALEILTLVITGPSSVDKMMEAFTLMRIKYGEKTRFKMLINMMHTRGVSHVLFQVSCFRFLNTILNLSKSANMRVFLQYEMEEAGLDCEKIEQCAQGSGLEYDDLRKEIREWKMRYVDVDSILRMIKTDLRTEYPGGAMSEFHYDLQYGPITKGASAKNVEKIKAKNATTDFKNWISNEQRNDILLSYLPKPELSTGKPFHMASKYTTSVETKKSHKKGHGDIHSDASEDHSEGTTKFRVSKTNSTHMLHSPGAGNNKHTDSPATFLGSSDCSNTRRFSITSEIYEPYGLIFKSRLTNLTQSESTEKDKNWVLGTPTTVHDATVINKRQKNNHLQKTVQNGDIYKTDTLSDKYDSGVCVTYQGTEPGDDLYNMYWKNVHPGEKLTFHPHDQSGNSSDNETQRQSGKYSRKNSLDQGPLRWYNPAISTSNSGRRPDNIQTNATNNNQNMNCLSKPPTPTPDYTNDDIDDAELPFFPKQSSTMKAGLKATAAKTLNRVDRNKHDIHDVPNQIDCTKKTANTQTNHENIKRPPSSQKHRNSQTSSRATSTNDFIYKIPESFAADARNHSTTKLQSKKVSDVGQIKRAVSDVHNVSSTSVRNGGYQRQNKNEILADVPGDSSVSGGFTFKDANGGSYLSQESMEEVPYLHTQQGNSSRTKKQATSSREEKCISRSLISLLSNESEQIIGKHVQRNKSGNRHLRKDDQQFNRRASVSDYKPVLEQARRHSLVTGTYSKGICEDQRIKSIQRTCSEMDSLRSYSAEIGRVLSDLDKALEIHDWQASMKAQVKRPSLPFAAYV